MPSQDISFPYVTGGKLCVLSVHFKHKQVTAVENFHLLRVDDLLPRVGIVANVRLCILLCSSGTDIVAVIPSGSILGHSYQTLFYKGPHFLFLYVKE